MDHKIINSEEEDLHKIVLAISFILLLPLVTSITTVLPNYIHYLCIKINRIISKFFPSLVCVTLYHLYAQQIKQNEGYDKGSILLKTVLALMPQTYKNGDKLLVFLHYIQDVICITYLYSMCQSLCTKIQTSTISTNTNISLKKQIINTIGGYILNYIKYIPFVSNILSSEMEKIELSIADLFPNNDQKKNYKLPKVGINDDELLSNMKTLVDKEDNKWKNGYCSGSVYHGGNEHIDILNKASSLYSVSNPLHLDIWPSLRKYEAEVISMTCNLLNGGKEDVCGTMTSGGTESIVLATKAHRDWYCKEKGIVKPEIIAGVTAHAAIDKACDILNIKLIKVPVHPETYKVDIDYVKKFITANTIMIYSSAPNFPQGIIDDIESLSNVACDYDVGLHVDCCLGGFILPFARDLGYDIPSFDFTLDGVTSMSCDTHKV